MIEWKPKYWLVVHILFIASCRRQQQQNQLQFRFQSTDFRFLSKPFCQIKGI